MMDAPEYNKIETVDEADKLIDQRHSMLLRTLKHQAEIRDSKKDFVKSCNEQLKEAQASIDHHVAVLEGLRTQRKLLENKF